jgi:hypothetical protein
MLVAKMRARNAGFSIGPFAALPRGAENQNKITNNRSAILIELSSLTEATCDGSAGQKRLPFSASLYIRRKTAAPTPQPFDVDDRRAADANELVRKLLFGSADRITQKVRCLVLVYLT